MGGVPEADVTCLLEPARIGDDAATDKLLPLVYEELRVRAAFALRAERSGHTLQPTAVVHEAYLRLVDQTQVDWKGRTHFLAVASATIRRILVDHARKRLTAKRGGDRNRVTVSEGVALCDDRDVDLLALDEALGELGSADERASRVVELRFFGGLTGKEIAAHLEVSERTVHNDWVWARAWLRRTLEGWNIE